jgi:transposase InsO family protein
VADLRRAGSRPTSPAATRRGDLRVLITAVFDGSEQTYGYRRVHAHLRRAGVCVGPELVRHLMGELDLVPCQPRPFRLPLTAQDTDQPAIPDLVERDFTAAVPGTKMVGDITYVPTWEGWVYLATVIDCYWQEGHRLCDGRQLQDTPDHYCYPPRRTQ